MVLFIIVQFMYMSFISKQPSLLNINLKYMLKDILYSTVCRLQN